MTIYLGILTLKIKVNKAQYQPLNTFLRFLSFLFFKEESCSSFFFFLINLFIYLFMAALGFHCCEQAFSSCGEPGGCSSLQCAGFSCRGARAVGTRASVVLAHRLQ